MPHTSVARVPDGGSLLSITDRGISIVHPNVSAVSISINPWNLHPNERTAAFIPHLNLMGQCCAVAIRESQVLPGVLGLQVINVGWVEDDQDRDVDESLR